MNANLVMSSQSSLHVSLGLLLAPFPQRAQKSESLSKFCSFLLSDSSKRGAGPTEDKLAVCSLIGDMKDDDFTNSGGFVHCSKSSN